MRVLRGCVNESKLCLVSRSRKRELQPLQLGLFRSDYLVHAPADGKTSSLKQVEFNTISSSFGTLSERSANLHRCAHLVSVDRSD